MMQLPSKLEPLLNQYSKNQIHSKFEILSIDENQSSGKGIYNHIGFQRIDINIIHNEITIGSYQINQSFAYLSDYERKNNNQVAIEINKPAAFKQQLEEA